MLYQLVSKSTALLFVHIFFLICFGAPCGDQANEKELGFTCTLYHLLFYEDLTIQPPAWPVDKIIFRGTAVLVDYFANLDTALFLTAAHAVSATGPAFIQRAACMTGFKSHDVSFARAPHTDLDIVWKFQFGKGHAEIAIQCHNKDTNLAIEHMWAYPVELAPDNDGQPEMLYLPKIRYYETPFDLDIAVVVALVNDEFISLWAAGSLKAIKLPPRQLDENFIRQFYSTKIDVEDYYKVRVGGSGSCDPIVCNAEFPSVPLFSNFGIDYFAKLVNGHLDRVNEHTINWQYMWPLTVEDVMLYLKPKPCREFHVHAPAHGLRSTCFGDSGGPVYLPESQTLIGIITHGDCTHTPVTPDRVSSWAVLLTNTEVQTWYYKIRGLVERGVIPVDKALWMAVNRVQGGRRNMPIIEVKNS